MKTFVGLLRGINVGGHNKIPMGELRTLCASLGYGDVRSYIQSGNLIFAADAPAAQLEAELERAIQRRFDLKIPVIVRTATDWSRFLGENPFPDASESEPNLVMLGLSKSAPRTGVAEELTERGDRGERAILVGDALWIHFAGGSGRSKITPSLLDRLVGSPVTTRNCRTVAKLGELAGDSA